MDEWYLYAFHPLFLSLDRNDFFLCIDCMTTVAPGDYGLRAGQDILLYMFINEKYNVALKSFTELLSLKL